MVKIKSITCEKRVNSRADWTIETKVTLDDGSVGVQTVPDGASKGENEAIYIPVEKAIDVVTTVFNDALEGEDPLEQEAIDELLIQMDGTPNKKHLGGNSILSVSLAMAKAAAASSGLELYEYLSKIYTGKILKRPELKFPIPIFNVLNGGKHAQNKLSFQEFMVIPASGTQFNSCMELGVKVYQSLKTILHEDGYETSVGDEGGFAPKGFTVKKALEYVKRATGECCSVGKSMFLGMDVAAESFYRGGEYFIEEEELFLNQAKMISYYKDLLKDFELIYIEDPFYEKDLSGWGAFYKNFNDRLMVVGDDLVVTNPKFLKKAIDPRIINAVIVKPNQVGTLTETLRFIKMAQKSGMQIVMSHRSGDTSEDTFIADLSLAVGAEFIKSGAPVRGERVAKYNRLLDIFNP